MKIKTVRKDGTAICTESGDWLPCINTVGEFAWKNKGKEFEVDKKDDKGVIISIKLNAAPAPSSKDERITRMWAIREANKLYCTTMEMAGKVIHLDESVPRIQEIADKFEDML